jgi:hypothetical protein
MLQSKKESNMKLRDFHKLAIIKKEAKGNTTAVPSKKVYSRKRKHKTLKRKNYDRECFK